MATLDWNKLILTTTFSIYYFLFPWRNMVCKGVSTPPPPPPISKPCPHFLKLHILPPYHQIGHPKFPYSQKYRNASVKLSSINTTHVKQQHCWLFHFGMFISKKHARQCLYMISLYCREGFSHPFNFFVVSKGILHV